MPARALRKLCAVALLCLPGCHHEPPAPSAGKPPEAAPLKTAVLTVVSRPWPRIVRTQGTLIADEATTIGAKVAGLVSEVRVDLGDAVATGAPLVQLEKRDFELERAQAEAQLAQARAAIGLAPDDDVAAADPAKSPPVREARAVWDDARQQAQRLRGLRSDNAISQAELEAAEAAERVAEARHASALNSVGEKLALIRVRSAELDVANQRLVDSVTTAPFAGRVLERQVAPGAYVQVGQPLLQLVRTSTLRFRAMVPERYAKDLRVGLDVVLRIESQDEPRSATITRISPSLDELSRSLVFEADVENSDDSLQAGWFAEAEVVLDAGARALVLPRSAVVRFAGVEKVWRVVEGAASEAVVLVGRQEGERVEIVEGLAAGDQILVDGALGRVAKVEPLDPPESWIGGE